MSRQQIKQGWQVIRKYCTAGLAQKIENASLDSDPFLSAQDSDVATLKTLVIQKDDQNKDMYAVCYTWPSTNQIICTDVTVTAVGDDVKISFVELNGY
ncbi:hypothetical protein HYN59_00640 [Flavobacterium album]|uniref:Uncharacterized protein n=1 Tax=Flavobacterium album TaxID=2175091 RepID=A0A2S1QTX7_9FLAO|nr:hypothetical protein HYN59_00640 [Flavobacterium album]